MRGDEQRVVTQHICANITDHAVYIQGTKNVGTSSTVPFLETRKMGYALILLHKQFLLLRPAWPLYAWFLPYTR